MNSWPQFLQQQGAIFENEGLLGFGEQPTDYPKLLDGNILAPLTELATLQLVDGALEHGSQKLLQGQVTCDIDKLSTEQSLFGAHCTPKGRAVANFQIVETNSGNVTLILPANQQATTTTSLGKYAPFFKVSLQQGQQCLLGLAGPQANGIAQQLIGATATAPQDTGHCVHTSEISILVLGQKRLLLIVNPQVIETAWQTVCDQAKPVGPELWRLLDIRAGIGHIQAATSEEFIPQMLNMQSSHGENGAISFKKGCYTGQEVVARMHYLGKLKRRMYRLQTHSPEVAIGDHCYLPDQTQSQGNVISVARSDQGTMELLAVLTEKAAASEQLAFGTSPDSTQPIAVSQLPLPYSLEP
ncbi:folate-binding protein YgfZ [bacterium SCSIO 12696]|nr:folate-binding protein YgfZ [bacterium SCSIO 12696]